MFLTAIIVLSVFIGMGICSVIERDGTVASMFFLGILGLVCLLIMLFVTYIPMSPDAEDETRKRCGRFEEYDTKYNYHILDGKIVYHEKLDLDSTYKRLDRYSHLSEK